MLIRKKVQQKFKMMKVNIMKQKNVKKLEQENLVKIMNKCVMFENQDKDRKKKES
jgi:CRISPR/Cas system CSM-associated protein Csm2 small subunit